MPSFVLSFLTHSSLISMLSVMTLTFREVKQLAQSHTAMKRLERDSKARAPHADQSGPMPACVKQT